MGDKLGSFSDIIHVLSRDPSIESLRQLPTEEKLEFACRAASPLPPSPSHTYYLLQVLTLLRGTESSHPGEQDLISSTLAECVRNLTNIFESINRLDLCQEMQEVMVKTRRRITISPFIATVTVGAVLASILLYRSV
jgi:hypothetical protein